MLEQTDMLFLIVFQVCLIDFIWLKIVFLFIKIFHHVFYSKFDEDVQIAMAISSSLADQGIMAGQDLIGQSEIHSNTDRDRKKSRKKKK